MWRPLTVLAVLVVCRAGLAGEAASRHWAFVPLRKVEAPRGATASIDAFIESKLAESGVKASPSCDDATWLRRASLDLVGLPPTIEEQGAFAADESPERFERVVDDLLSRARYGERWGRHWLDVARFAETKGYERDETMPQAWRFRDWAVESFNFDDPYDQFLTHQLAGDLLPQFDSRSQIAAMFLSVGPFDTIVQNKDRARYDQLDDVIATTSQAFLGMTVQCARCHDHKFEPVTQVDYYRLLAGFSSLRLPARERDVGSSAEREAIQRKIEVAQRAIRKIEAEYDELRRSVLEPVYQSGKLTNGRKPRVRDRDRPKVLEVFAVPSEKRDKKQKKLLDRYRIQILDDFRDSVAEKERRDEFEALRSRVEAARSAVAGPPKAWLFPDSGKPSSTKLLVRGEVGQEGEEVSFGLLDVLGESASDVNPDLRRRRWLADWMTGEGRALVARVWVNRVWQYHFGRGFVSNANNLGVSGGDPSHPELLEWLASSFVESGWQTKRLQRAIVLSDAYRRSSLPAAGGNADPDNRLYSRWSVRRLEAEALRDSMLAVSGRLVARMGGPGVFPPIDNKVNGASAGDNWKKSNESDAARRSVYVFAKRAFQLPELGSLDQPQSEVSCEQRNVSTTAVQSLLLLNSRFAWSQAVSLAERLKAAEEDEEARLDLAIRIVHCREPRTRERELFLAFLEETKSSEESKKLDPWASLCLVLLNTNEFAYLN